MKGLPLSIWSVFKTWKDAKKYLAISFSIGGLNNFLQVFSAQSSQSNRRKSNGSSEQTLIKNLSLFMNHNLVAISTSWGTLTIISSTASKASLPGNCIRNVQFVLSENKSESQILNHWNKCSINSDLWSPKWSSQTHRAYTHFSRSRNIYLYLLIQTHVLVWCEDGDGACTTWPIYSLTYVQNVQKGGDTCTCTNSRPM